MRANESIQTHQCGQTVCVCVCYSFPEQVQSGLLEVISPSPFYYPDWSNLSQTLGDPLDRVK